MDTNEMPEKLQEKKEDISDRESSVESFHTNKSEPSIATESELIDVDDIELSDEESWLYKSPKRLSSSEKTLSTYKRLGYEVGNVKDNAELRSTRDALANKISQLQLHGIGRYAYTSKPIPVCPDAGSHEALKANISDPVSKNSSNKISVKGKENEILDVTDVCKMAQLQEESLRQSSYRFLNLTEKRGYLEKNNLLMQNTKLNKPASAEDLNLFTERRNAESAYNSVPLHQMKKQNIFNSASCLHEAQDCHHGSLPNINPGYYSLRIKKSRKSTDQRLPCPLPLHPTVKSRLKHNGSASDILLQESQAKHLTSPTKKDPESRTLPSSYRTHSRSSSTSRHNSKISSPRHESPVSYLLSPRNSPSLARRDSAPCSAPKFYTSPLSSPTLYQRSKGISSPPVLRSPTKSWRNPPKDLKTRPSPTETQRSNSSHSPSRRLPLTTVVHNRSPKSGMSPASPCPFNEELRNCKLQSKIPSPGSPVRSGIPVPSSFPSKMNSDDESWSHDCY